MFIEGTVPPEISAVEALEAAYNVVMNFRRAQRKGAGVVLAFVHTEPENLVSVIRSLSIVVCVMADKFRMSDDDITNMFEAGIASIEEI